MLDKIQVNLDGPAIEALVSKAILDDIGPEQRDKLLQAALKGLLQPMYEQGPTHLQHVFTDSARRVAAELIREQLLQDPGFKERVQTFVVATVDRVLKNPDAIEAGTQLIVAAFERASRDITR